MWWVCWLSLSLKQPFDSHVKSLSFLYRLFLTHAEVEVASLPVRIALGPGEVAVDGKLIEDWMECGGHAYGDCCWWKAKWLSTDAVLILPAAMADIPNCSMPTEPKVWAAKTVECTQRDHLILRWYPTYLILTWGIPATEALSTWRTGSSSPLA